MRELVGTWGWFSYFKISSDCQKKRNKDDGTGKKRSRWVNWYCTLRFLPSALNCGSRRHGPPLPPIRYDFLEKMKCLFNFFFRGAAAVVVGEEEKRTELRTQLVNKTTCESLVIVFVGRDMKRYRHQRTPHPSTQSWWEPFSHSLFRLGTSAKQLPLFNLSTVGGGVLPLSCALAAKNCPPSTHKYLARISFLSAEL